MCKKKLNYIKDVSLRKVVCPCCGREEWLASNPIENAVIFVDYSKHYATIYNQQEVMRLLAEAAVTPNAAWNFYIFKKPGITDAYWCSSCNKWFVRLNKPQAGCCKKEGKEPITLRV